MLCRKLCCVAWRAGRIYWDFRFCTQHKSGGDNGRMAFSPRRPTMFDQLFSQPSTLARHRHSPYAVERRRYLSHLMEEGHSRSNLLDIAAVLISLARHLPLHQPTICHAEIEASAEAWTKTIHRSAKCLIVGKRQFIFCLLYTSRCV